MPFRKVRRIITRAESQKCYSATSFPSDFIDLMRKQDIFYFLFVPSVDFGNYWALDNDNCQ